MTGRKLETPKTRLGRRILGLDPGSRVAGFACIVTKRSVAFTPKDFTIVEAGVLKADVNAPHAVRIGLLHETLYELVQELQPDVCIVEKAFSGLNAMSALKLGEARGALISAVQRCRVPTREVTPAQVKKNIAGSGAASKEEVNLVLRAMMGFEKGTLPYDVSDALAIALYYGLAMAPTDDLPALTWEKASGCERSEQIGL